MASKTETMDDCIRHFLLARAFAEQDKMFSKLLYSSRFQDIHVHLKSNRAMLPNVNLLTVVPNSRRLAFIEWMNSGVLT